MKASSSDLPERRPRIPEEIHASRVIAIGRRLEPNSIPQVAEALVAGGVRAFEVTLDSPDAIDAIRSLAERHTDGSLLVGAGTVLDVASAAAAVQAGARFLVSPHTDLELIDWAVSRRMPFFPGAFTASEILAAWRAGASAVKLFPASAVGPAYVREMRGPLADVPLIPTGGVTLENAAAFIAAGAVAVGVGSWLTAGATRDVIRQRAAQMVRALATP
ncbi:MAG TPA: bifunctional 4-hydroxy-2-oxoglutarate aldolase/2-dehydro-3-deoxy-phosphogluconate aldolase [Candidatus Dormibacteraeota bacterium]|nr:bifunctional 4-hydroxy-2-oxoglutarate aldolase/2-dehydro-3-deoxy-phosphogluconate aldolase [Candidatus Dormibacteraeota bacterium]